MDSRTATLLAVVAVVAIGIAWYERSRPAARIVALVAALTALAVAGRLVLAPVPNAVGTTDVAILTGYALGGAPGFTVGALAAPISNIWLGQGPWTLWQMAAWGLCGAGGAALAVLTARRLGRLGLALACGAGGLLYGAFLDLSVMVTYGGEQSVDRYLALSVAGIPFNIVHAVGNFAIAYAAGPALVRMIGRFRERLTFTWHPAGALPAVLLVTVVAASLMPAQSARADAAGGSAWLERAQNSDGGFGPGAGQPSSPGMTAWAMLGLEAAGVNPRDVRSSGSTPVDYLASRARSIRSATDLERTILALEGAGVNSRAFAGRDLPAALLAQRRSDGSWEGQVNITAFGVLALRAARAGDVGRSAAWLRDAQSAGGGWGFAPGRAGDADSTGAALQALAAAGGSDAAIDRGARYLVSTQKRSGAWTLSGGAENSQSTAWALQGLVAAGVGGSAVGDGAGYLTRMQAGDGHYRYSPSSDQTPVWVTAQALTGVTRRAFPIAAVPRAPKGGGGGGSAPSGAPGPAGVASPGAAGRGGRTRRASSADASKRRTQAARVTRGPTDERPRLRAGAEPGSATAEGEPTAASSPEGGMSDGAKVGAGLGGLALALAGGFVWYRRTLP